MSLLLNTLSLVTQTQKSWHPTLVTPTQATMSHGLRMKSRILQRKHIRTTKSCFQQPLESYDQSNQVLGEKANVNCDMDLGGIAKFLENKTFLLTGATGYVAKILLEKILRVQPNVKKVYLIIRAANANAVEVRQINEVFGKELFNVLRYKLGHNFDSLISEKIISIAGDTSYANFGLDDDDDRLKEMQNDIDIVINAAANTNFDERYDVAFRANTLGPKHVIEFAKNCDKIQLLIHVSTAYVSGEKAGLIPENTYAMGETLNGVAGLNIDYEKELIEQTLQISTSKDRRKKEFKQKMMNLGTQRAKLYGWPNTYTFTKAMGEMLVSQHRGDLPVIILRPPTICSTFKEPFSGWIDGCRTIDIFIVSYGKGRLSFIPFDGSSVMDMIPADMFVNLIIVAMKAHVNQQHLVVYHVGSSYRNPITIKEFFEILYFYFIKNPWRNKESKSVNVRKMVLWNRQILQIIVFLWNFMGHMILNNVASRIGVDEVRQILLSFDRKLKLTTKLEELYRPYLFFKGIFMDTNTEKLVKVARENGLDEDVFNFDSKSINWKEFLINVHYPAVVKYLM